MYDSHHFRKPIAITIGALSLRNLLLLFLLERACFLIIFGINSITYGDTDWTALLVPLPYLFWLMIFVGAAILKENLVRVRDLVGISLFRSKGSESNQNGLNVHLFQEFRLDDYEIEAEQPNRQDISRKRVTRTKGVAYVPRIKKPDSNTLYFTRRIFGNSWVNLHIHLIGGVLILIGFPLVYFAVKSNLFAVGFTVPFLDSRIVLRQIDLSVYDLKGIYMDFFVLYLSPFVAYFAVSLGSLLTMFFEYYVFLWVFGNKMVKKIEKNPDLNTIEMTFNGIKEFPLIKHQLNRFSDLVQSVLIKSLVPLAILLVAVALAFVLDPLHLREQGLLVGAALGVFGWGLALLIMYPILYFFPLLTNRKVLNSVKQIQLGEIENLYWKQQYDFVKELNENQQTDVSLNLEKKRQNIDHLKVLKEEIERISTWPYNISELRAFGTTLFLAVGSTILTVAQVFIK